MNSLIDYIKKHKNWSIKTFGPGLKTKNLCKHIKLELEEIEKFPLDPMEWVDVIILAIDGLWRLGYPIEKIPDLLEEKQIINFNRRWKVGSEDEPAEHIKGE